MAHIYHRFETGTLGVPHFSRSLREVGLGHDSGRIRQRTPLGKISYFGPGPTFANPGQTWGTLRSRLSARLQSYTSGRNVGHPWCAPFFALFARSGARPRLQSHTPANPLGKDQLLPAGSHVCQPRANMGHPKIQTKCSSPELYFRPKRGLPAACVCRENSPTQAKKRLEWATRLGRSLSPRRANSRLRRRWALPLASWRGTGPASRKCGETRGIPLIPHHRMSSK